MTTVTKASIVAQLKSIQAELAAMPAAELTKQKQTLAGYTIDYSAKTIMRKGIIKASFMPRYRQGQFATIVGLVKADRLEDAAWILSIPTKAERTIGEKVAIDLDLDSI